MATNYPGSLDTGTEQPSPLSTTEMDDAGFEHDVVHTNHSEAIIALETKVGVGSSSAVADSVLAGTGSGTSSWSTAPSLAGLTVDTDTLHVDATNDRVGIGTTTPERALHVNSGTTNTSALFESTDANVRIYMQDSGSTDAEQVGFLGISDDLRLVAGGGARLTIQSDGNVGIGTTTPESILHLNPGTNLTPDANGVGHIMIDGSNYTSFFTMDATGTWIGNNSNGRSMILATDETARLTVTGTGSVGIGDTAPNSQLEVVSTSQRAFRFARDEDVGANAVTCGIMQIGTNTTNPGTDDYWILFRRGNGTTIGSVRGTGSASVNFSTTSDSTLKTDRGIATASRIGTIIDGLQVHEFDWNEGDVNGQIGLFAQEAIDVLPESIVNAPTTMPGDEESDDDEYVPAALDYSKIVPILIAECQFLRARVTALEAA